jgi:putative flippase GtrA
VAVGLASSDVERFLRFAIVGGVGFLIDVSLLAALHHGAGLDPFSSRLTSITASAFTTWRLNRMLTFGASGTSQAAEGLRYAAVAALTVCFNYLVYALELIVFDELPPIAAAVLATLAAMTLSYVGYSRFVFQGSSTPTKFVSARSHSR